MSPQETDPDLPVSLQQSTGAYYRVRGIEYSRASTRPIAGGCHYFHYIHHSFGLRSNNREGTLPCPSTKSWIKDLLSMALPIRTRPSFSQSQFSSVQFICSVMSNSAIAWTAARQASLYITNSWSLLKFMSTEAVMPSNHLILCHPLCSCLQSCSASEYFTMSQFFTSGGQILEFQLQHQSFR